MIVALVLDAVLKILVGFAFGACVCLILGPRRRVVASPGSQDAPRTESLDTSVLSDFARSQHVLDSFHDLVGTIGESVEQHSVRVAAISEDLAGATNVDPATLLAALSKLLTANQQLQTDSSAAQAEIRQQQRKLDFYMRQAQTDASTGLANRRAFEQELTWRFAEWQRTGTSLSLAIIDVDHFKDFNDRHGHQIGDEVLKGIAQVLRSTARETDLVARYGGEEFVVIQPGTNLNDAKQAAERLRSAVANSKFLIQGMELQATVSVGVAEVRPPDGTDTLIQHADAALYAAKNNGRNRGYFHNSETCEPITIIQRRARRYALKSTQRIASIIDGRRPDLTEFREVVCKDISSAGFSYLVPQPPDYQHLILELRTGEDPLYISATVKNAKNIGSESIPLRFFGPNTWRGRFFRGLGPFVSRDPMTLGDLAWNHRPQFPEQTTHAARRA